MENQVIIPSILPFYKQSPAVRTPDTGGCKFVKIFATPGWRITSVCYSHQYEACSEPFAEGTLSAGVAVVRFAVDLVRFQRLDV